MPNSLQFNQKRLNIKTMEIQENNDLEKLPILLESLEEHNEAVLRTEEEILEIIRNQELEEVTKETLGFTVSQFEDMLKTEILEEARKLKVVQPAKTEETISEKLEVLKKQKFAIWFFWDSLNTIQVERGLIVNIYIHTSAKDIIHNKDIWKMLRDILKKCHSKEGGLVEGTNLEVRSKMLSWRILPELHKMKRQVVTIGNREEEFDLIGNHRILAVESEQYTVTMTDRVTGISASGRGNIKYRNQIDWGTKLELSRKVREYEFSHRENNDT